MQAITVQAVPNQTLAVILGGQGCQINLYQKRSGLYCDLIVASQRVLSGMLCQNLNRLIRDQYFGFIGDLGFYDSAGLTDPVYAGLGARYQFLYLEADDVVYDQPFFGVGAVRGSVFALTQ